MRRRVARQALVLAILLAHLMVWSSRTSVAPPAAASRLAAEFVDGRVEGAATWRRVEPNRTVTVSLYVWRGATAQVGGGLTGIAANTNQGVTANLARETCQHYPISCAWEFFSSTALTGLRFTVDPALGSASFEGTIEGVPVTAAWKESGPLESDGGADLQAPPGGSAWMSADRIMFRSQEAELDAPTMGLHFRMDATTDGHLAYRGFTSAVLG